MPIRTGMENVLAHQVDKTFAYAAEDDGVIKKKSKKWFTVLYKNGETVSVEIGLRIASSKGAYYRHDLVCDLEEGYKFKKGEILMFNSAFFTRDVFNIQQVVPRDKVLLRTMFVENNDTFEDSSALYEPASRSLGTKSIKQKFIVVNASDILSQVAEVGDYLEVNSHLCFIEDATFGTMNDKFGKQSIDMLRKMSRQSPRAGVKGKVIKREIIYFCEEEDMSTSIKELHNEINSENFAGTNAKVGERRDLTGKVNQPLKFGSSYLGEGMVGIRFYLESDLGCAGGDKIIFGNQLKSVIARTFSEKHETESGREIQAMFSYTSVSNRVCASPEIMGTLNVLLKEVTRKAVAAYHG